MTEAKLRRRRQGDKDEGKTSLIHRRCLLAVSLQPNPGIDLSDRLGFPLREGIANSQCSLSLILFDPSTYSLRLRGT